MLGNFCVEVRLSVKQLSPYFELGTSMHTCKIAHGPSILRGFAPGPRLYCADLRSCCPSSPGLQSGGVFLDQDLDRSSLDGAQSFVQVYLELMLT